MDFGIISEGVTDQIVIENILFGFFKDKNLLVNPLQPKSGEAGNWDKVFKYCASDDFRQAFSFLDYVIVHMEIDFMRRQEVPEAYRFDPTGLSPEAVYERMRDKIIAFIGQDFFQQFSQRIIFAIAVDSTECWFLPIYFPNKPKIAGKTTNCLQTLNTILTTAEGFSIHAKEEKYYRKISKKFQKRKDLLGFAKKNPSLHWFLEGMAAIPIR